jgi:hypothetical protein
MYIKYIYLQVIRGVLAKRNVWRRGNGASI